MAKSLRAAHWKEALHPRDDRGRFSRKGGGRWMAKVAKELQAQFGDISMGAHPQHVPQGKLRAGVIDTAAISRAAPRMHGPERPPVGAELARVGRTPAGLGGVGRRADGQAAFAGSAGPTDWVQPGVHHNEAVTDVNKHELGRTPAALAHQTPGAPPSRRGRTPSGELKAGPTPTSDSRQGAIARAEGQAAFAGSAGPTDWTQPVVPPSTGARNDTGVDTSRVGRKAGGVTTPAATTPASPTPELLAARLRRHGLDKIAKDVEAGRYRKAETALHQETTSGRLARATFEKRNDARAIYNDLTRMQEPQKAEDFGGRVVVKSGSGWAVRGNEEDRKALGGAYLYTTKTKADAEDWARTHTAAQRAMREGRHEDAIRINQKREAALTGGEGRAYRPQGSVAMVSAAAAKEREAGFRGGQEAPGNRYQARYNPGGDNYHVVETDAQGHALGVASQEFDTQEEAVRDAARRNSEDLAAFDAAQAPGGITDPLDQAMIREAIAERGGGYYGGPMGLSKGDAARYLTEGHLKALTDKYGYDNVRTAVAAEIDRNPAALNLKPGSPEWKAAQAARLEASQTASKQAMAALKAGQHDEAARIIREAQLAHPSYREQGHSFGEMLGFINQQRGSAPSLPEPSRTNAGPAADNAHGGNFAADVRAGLGSGDQLARETAPRTGRTPAGVQSVNAELARSTEGVARNLRDKVQTREAAHAELEGLTAAELRQVAKHLNRTLAGLTNKQQMRERLVESTVGSRITSDVLRRNGMGPVGRTAAGVVGTPGSGFVEPPRAGGITPTAGQLERANEVARIENARANFGAGPVSTKPEVGRRPDGSYKYDNYSQAGHDLGNLTVAEAGIPDQGAVHSQYQQILKHISTIQRQGPARVGSKDQYYRPMTKSLEQAAQYVHEHEGNPATVAKLRALADIYRPNTDKAPDLVSGADIRSRRAAMASAMGVDMNDPRRWTHSLGDVRNEVFAKASRDIPQYYTHPDLMAANERLKSTSIHDTAGMDNAARELHAIGDRIRAQQADFASAGQRMKAALEGSGGLTDMETAVRADTRRLKKEHGIPGDAAIRKLPPGERQAAEDALFKIQAATRARVARENNLKQVAIVRAEIARGGMSPVNAEAWAKRADRTENMATPEAIANAERERDTALAAWRHAKGATGTKGEYPSAQLAGLDHEEQTHATILARNVSLDAADNFVREVRASKGVEAPGLNTDYTGFTPQQAEGLRGLEHNPLQHAAARERLAETNRQQAETAARRAQELADVRSAPLPVHGTSNEEQAAAMRELARQVDPNKFKGGKLFNEHVVEGHYSASIQDAYGKRVLNYDGRTGTWTNGNGGKIAPNQVHAYIAEYNRHDNFSRDPNYMKSLVDSEVPPDFSTLPPPPVDTRPRMVQLRERKAMIQRRLEGARGDVARQLRYRLHDVNQDIETEQAALDKAARTAPAGPASDRFKPGDYLGPGEAYMHRADLVGHTVTFNAPVPGSRAGKRQDITGKVVDVKSLSGGTSTHILIEGRSRPLVLDSGLNVVEPKGGKGRAPAGVTSVLDRVNNLSPSQIAKLDPAERDGMVRELQTLARTGSGDDARRAEIALQQFNTDQGREAVRRFEEMARTPTGIEAAQSEAARLVGRRPDGTLERPGRVGGPATSSYVQPGDRVRTGGKVRTVERVNDAERRVYFTDGSSMTKDMDGTIVGRPEAGPAGRYSKLTDEQIRQGLQMRGSTDAELVAEAKRRGIPINPGGSAGKAEAGGGPGAGVDTARVTRDTGGMTATTRNIGPMPQATGYAKGREVRPGMLINAADLLPMHESQGNTTGENPNPRGHSAWIRVGLVGNTNNPAYQSYNSNRSLTGGMYVVFDQSGHPVGRMSANTIAEINDADVRPEAELQHLRVPTTIRVKVRNPRTGEVTTEERPGFDMALVPSKFAQQEAGMPAPKMLSEGIVHPDDPHYGVRGQRPQPQHRPFGERVQGTRTREQTAAERQRRAEVYAAGEPERAARRAEEEARRREERRVEREQEAKAAKAKQDERLEQYRRDDITRSHEYLVRALGELGGEERARDTFRHRNDRGVRLTAEEYGVKTRGKGVTRETMIDGIIEAVKAGRQPDYEIHAPKPEPTGDAVAEAEAKKIAAADKRRRTTIMANFDRLKADLHLDEVDPQTNWRGKPDRRADFTYGVMMSDTQIRQLAEAYGLEGLTGQALRDAVFEAIRSGRIPDLDLAPITSLKKKR